MFVSWTVGLLIRELLVLRLLFAKLGNALPNKLVVEARTAKEKLQART
jgi:hypothetical protein